MSDQEREELARKVRKYEEFLHAINAAVVACDHNRVQRLVDNAFQWSYAHRAGNGEPDEDEQRARIWRAFNRLTDTGE